MAISELKICRAQRVGHSVTVVIPKLLAAKVGIEFGSYIVIRDNGDGSLTLKAHKVE